MVRQILRNDGFEKQIHPRYPGRNAQIPHAGTERHHGALLPSLPQNQRSEREDADAGRFQTHRTRRGQHDVGRPVGHPDRKYACHRQHPPHSRQEDGADTGLRRKGAAHLGTVHPAGRAFVHGRPFVEPRHAQPCTGIHRQGEYPGDMAPYGTLRPWRDGFPTVSGAVPENHPVARHALHGDLQRLGGLFRHRRGARSTGDAAHARLRYLLRIPAHRPARRPHPPRTPAWPPPYRSKACRPE